MAVPGPRSSGKLTQAPVTTQWTLTGTTGSGLKLKVNGCDHWTFRDGEVIEKNSYWKIVER